MALGAMVMGGAVAVETDGYASISIGAPAEAQVSLEGVAMEMGETMTDAIRRVNTSRIEKMAMNSTDKFRISRDELTQGLRSLLKSGEIGICEAALTAKNIKFVDVEIRKDPDKLIVTSRFRGESGENVGNTRRTYRKH